MKKTAHRIIIAIIISAFVVVGSLVSVSLINSKNIAVYQAEKSLSYMSKSYARDFDSVFSQSELAVSSMAASIESEYDVSLYINDRSAFEKTKAKTSEMMKKVTQDFEYPAGFYLTYAPETSRGWDEIWYLKKENGETLSIDSLSISDGWLGQDEDSTAYYFETIKNGSMWLDATYDPGMRGETVSYTRALYDRNGLLIGVLGVDILVDDIFNTLKNIDSEISGHSAFLENDSVVAGADIGRIGNTGSSGSVSYESEDYIYAKAHIGEKWALSLMQPVDVAVGSIRITEAAVILLGILIVVTAVFLVMYYSRKHVNPIIEEAEIKDALLVSKARQAKMGEMVGNIAHQWKQPLNSMKMALSNMQEDYSQGMLDDEDFENYIYRMNLMVNNLAETADDFTAFLRPGKKTEVFSANREIERTIHLMEERIRLKGIVITVDGPEVFIEGYRNEFGQCVFNLIDNAFAAIEDRCSDSTDGSFGGAAGKTGCCRSAGRTIEITTAVEEAEESDPKGLTGKKPAAESGSGPAEICGPAGSVGIIRIFNSGSPIPEENADRIFDLYFTTKEEKEGTGIGLYLVRQILRTHFRGDISFENVRDGVCFEIRIPVHHTSSSTDAE